MRKILIAILVLIALSGCSAPQQAPATDGQANPAVDTNKQAGIPDKTPQQNTPPAADAGPGDQNLPVQQEEVSAEDVAMDLSKLMNDFDSLKKDLSK